MEKDLNEKINKRIAVLQGLMTFAYAILIYIYNPDYYWRYWAETFCKTIEIIMLSNKFIL